MSAKELACQRRGAARVGGLSFFPLWKKMEERRAEHVTLMLFLRGGGEANAIPLRVALGHLPPLTLSRCLATHRFAF